MLKLNFLVLLAVIVSCGKAPEMQNPVQKSSGETLQGKTEEEVVQIKYREPFKLDCGVRIVKGEFINLNIDPKDQFSWSMADDLTLMRVLHYKVDKAEMIIVVKIDSSPEILPHVTHRTENFKEYFMENTPVLKIRYRRAPKKILFNGNVHETNAYTDVKLYENIEERIFTISSELNDGLITDDFRCTLSTKINPFFADQWKQIL